MHERRQLRALVSEVYERRGDEVRVSPAWLATEAMQQLDPDRTAPAMVWAAAHLHLRQVAREICRERFEGEAADGDAGAAEQHELFPDLQRRYPAAHSTGSEPDYVLLEHLRDEDVAFNVRRLRSEGEAKVRHADALAAWWHSRPAAAA